jgi:hypothetical protein
MSGSEKKKFNFKAGIIGSMIGGLVMSIPMGMMGSLPSIASMVGSDSIIVGFIVHMVISLIFGVAFAVFAGLIKFNAIVKGAIFGIIIWLIGPLLLMPMLTGGTNACGAAACGTAKTVCGTVSDACGTANKSACGTVSDACGTASKSACGTVSDACGTANKSACGDLAASANPCANPCSGGGGAAGMLMGLATHLLYGVILGASYKMLANRA